MLDEKTVVELRVEKIRLAWEFTVKEADVRRQECLEVFAVLVAIGLGALFGVVLERVSPLHGIAAASLAFAGAIWSVAQLRAANRKLRQSLQIALSTIDSLIKMGEP